MRSPVRSLGKCVGFQWLRSVKCLPWGQCQGKIQAGLFLLALLLGLGGCLAEDKTELPAGPLPAVAGSAKPRYGMGEADRTGLRGTWVQGRSIRTKDLKGLRSKIDEVLRRATTGDFNAIFVSVFSDGRTAYRSQLAERREGIGPVDKVEPGFDPLAYLVREAHGRNIQVHAWFAVGRIGDEEGSPILGQHPDWGLVGPEGQRIAWLNFARPEARQFMSDLMLEVVEGYGVDGVHFDYTRYPGPEWGFDAYSLEVFTKQYGLDLNQLRYSELPAYGLFEANVLGSPASAQVLATFANGLPAVTINSYGKGEVIVLNWKANQRMVAAGGEILQRSLRRLLAADGEVYLLRSETNGKEYGYEGFLAGLEWLRDLGWAPIKVSDQVGPVGKKVPDLSPDSVLVMPNIYLISKKTADRLADFVSRGGGVIFIDGPTRSIGLEEMQAMTGMTKRGGYFKEWTLMTAAGEHPLIPNSQRGGDLRTYHKWDARWKEFRKQSINALIEDVFRRVKAKDSEATVSVTITSDQEQAAQEDLQDWRAWLEGGYVDLLIPRVYIDDLEALTLALGEWGPVVQDHDRLTFGLIVFVDQDGSEEPKPPGQLLTEIEMVQAAGSNGLMIFDLDRMSDEQLQAMSEAPFSN